MNIDSKINKPKPLRYVSCIDRPNANYVYAWYVFSADGCLAHRLDIPH